ncbi:MAG: J domain-containing protein [Actinomycetota bacterium]
MGDERTGEHAPTLLAVGHYEVLGVTPDASMSDIKKAYLAAARDAHPDFHTQSEAARQRAEVRMREINAAWAVLGDVDERSFYDRQRLTAERGGTASPRFHATSTGQPFRPFHPDDELDEDHPFDERDDRPITNSRLPVWVTMLPASLIVGGFLSLLFGAFVGILPLVNLGLVSMVLGGVAFLTVPIIAVGMAARADRRA